MDFWETTKGEGWGVGNTIEADRLKRLGFEDDGVELKPSPLFQLVAGSAPGTVNLGTLLPLFLPSFEERYVNGFPWGSPGISYCLWQGVNCCIRFQPEQSEDFLAIWNDLGSLESWDDMEREPFGFQLPQNTEAGSSYEQVFSSAKSRLGYGSEKVPSGVFTPEMNFALRGLAEAGFDTQFARSCTYPFSVYSIDLSSVGLDGSLPESLGDLSRLSNLDVSNNSKLVGPVPASAEELGCLDSLEIWQTEMNCRDPLRQGRDCPVPPFMRIGSPSGEANAQRVASDAECGKKGSTLSLVQKTTRPLTSGIFFNSSLAVTCSTGLKEAGFWDSQQESLLTAGKIADVNKVVEADPNFSNYRVCQCPGGFERKEVIEDGAIVGVFCVQWDAGAIAVLCGVLVPVIIVLVALTSVIMSWENIRREVFDARFELVKRRIPPGMLPESWVTFVHRRKLREFGNYLSVSDLSAWFGACGLFSGAAICAHAPGTDRVPLPVTIVISDVEGSTEMWEHNPKATQIACDIHDKVMRKSAEAFCGYEITTEGDSFTFAFHEASDACAFCLHAQRELMIQDWPKEIFQERRAGPVLIPCGDSIATAQSVQIFRGLRVRMGVATGVPSHVRQHELTRRREYAGDVMWRARSLSDVPVGGQILLDQTTAALVGNSRAMETVSAKTDKARREGHKSGDDFDWSLVPRRMFSAIGRGLRNRFSSKPRESTRGTRASMRSYLEQPSHSSPRWSPFSSPRSSPSRSPHASREESRSISAREASAHANALLKTMDHDAIRARNFRHTFRKSTANSTHNKGKSYSAASGAAVLVSHGGHRLESALFHDSKDVNEDPENLVELQSSELLGRTLHIEGITTKKQVVPGFFDAPGGTLSLAFMLRGGLGISDVSGEVPNSPRNVGPSTGLSSDWSDGSYELRHAGTRNRISEEADNHYRMLESPSFRKHRKAHTQSRTLEDYLPDVALVVVTPNFQLMGRMGTPIDQEAVLAGFIHLVRSLARHFIAHESKIERAAAVLVFRHLREAVLFCLELQDVLQHLKLTQQGSGASSESLQQQAALRCDVSMPRQEAGPSRTGDRGAPGGSIKKVFFEKVRQRDASLSAACAVFWGRPEEIVPDRFTGRAVYRGNDVTDCVTLAYHANPGSVIMPRRTAEALLSQQERCSTPPSRGGEAGRARLTDIGLWRLPGSTGGRHTVHSLVQIVPDVDGRDSRPGGPGYSQQRPAVPTEGAPPLTHKAKRLSEGARREVGHFELGERRVDWTQACVASKLAARKSLETFRVAGSFESRSGWLQRWRGSGQWWSLTPDL
jgi:class 3 adenylate cyclase